MARFGSVLTAMVTPFDGRGDLDLGAAAAVAQFLEDQGNEGLVVAGTTGEAPTLGPQDKHQQRRAVRAAVNIPVIHPTGRRIAADVLLRLFGEVPNIVAFKDATGDAPATARLVAALGDAIEVYSGDDAMTLPLLAVGAVGVIGVGTHWAAPEFRELLDRWAKGDADGAREVNARLLPTFAFENSETCVFSQAAKAAMRVLGQPVGECRLPLGPAPDGTEDRAREVLRGLGRTV
jgi:4-hydroxy-tetrahydrodipicolinate synthase